MMDLIVFSHDHVTLGFQETMLERAFSSTATYAVVYNKEDVLEIAQISGGVGLIICDRTKLGEWAYLVEAKPEAAFLGQTPVVVTAIASDWSLESLKDHYHQGLLDVVAIFDLNDRTDPQKYVDLLCAA